MFKNFIRTMMYLTVALAVISGLAGFFGPAAIAQIKAALVRDSDNPALQPFQLTLAIPGCGALCDGSFNVPPGKRLVIQSVAFGIAGGSGISARASMTTVVNGVSVGYAIPMAPEYGYTGTARGSLYGQYYADPGTNVSFHLDFNGNYATQTDFLTISGYYVNVP